MMERNKRSKKRMTYLLNKFVQNINPLTEIDNELMAKDMLIQIADYQIESQSNTRRHKINGWFNNSIDQNTAPSSNQVKTVKNFRKTIYIKPFAETKIHHRSENQIERHHRSVIPFLKSQLQKLESPDKTQYTQDRQRKVQFLQAKIKRKNQPLIVQQLFETKRNSIRIKQVSVDKQKDNKVNWIHNFYETKPRKMLSRQSNRLLECKTSTEHAQFIKQARRNRTLRNILF